MVTDATRIALAKEAASSFVNQSWPVKELVVVNTTGVTLGLDREILFTVPPTTNHAELLRIGYCASGGEWCAVLEDNAWYEPGYLDAQMAQATDGVRVMLHTGIFYFDTRHRIYVRRWDTASYVFRRTVDVQMPAETTAAALHAAFKQVHLVETPVPLVTKFFYAESSD